MCGKDGQAHNCHATSEITPYAIPPAAPIFASVVVIPRRADVGSTAVGEPGCGARVAVATPPSMSSCTAVPPFPLFELGAGWTRGPGGDTVSAPRAAAIPLSGEREVLECQRTGASLHAEGPVLGAGEELADEWVRRREHL